MKRRWIAFPAAALAGAGLDLATKALVFGHFDLHPTTRLIPGVLSIQLTTNRGIAGGFLPSELWKFVSLAALPLVAAGFLLSKRLRAPELACGSLILAGAIGNAWDRIVLGSVRDWILLLGIPNFNLADAMLSCSVGALILLWIRNDLRPVGEARPAHAGEPDDGGVGNVGRDHGPSP